MRIFAAALLAGASLSLGGCAYGMYGSPGSGLSVGVSYGDPYGYGYSPYGYGSRYGRYDPWSSRYGGYPYWGWYGDRYYPGAGYYVYDRYGRPYMWNDRQRVYWTRVRERAVQNRDVRQRRELRPNWEAFEERDPRAEARKRVNEERRDPR